ncbi:MAG: GNAT family N-acetyltransferase, partial [Campylobacter sp.]|nr:GNAT family N-acetyltransferase [Campylobacter sp.]
RYQSSTKNEKFDIVKQATNKHIKEIFELINKTFDEKTDYLPNIDELKALITRQEVFIIEINSIIAGVSIYEKKANKCYLRLYCVHENFRGKKLGTMLVSSAPKYANSFYAWIDDKNEQSIRICTKMAYKNDGLKNYIFIRN